MDCQTQLDLEGEETKAITQLGYLFVSCQHPDSDASVSQALDGLRHPSLQLVLDGSAAQQ